MAQYALRLVLGLLVVLCYTATPLLAQDQVSLIPKPNKLEIHEGKYLFPPVSACYAFDTFHEVAELLADHPYTKIETTERIRSHKRIPETGIRLIQALEEDRLPENAYRLLVDSSGVRILAHQPDAMRDGIRTLLQLAYTQPNGWELPAMVIEDHPRFAYRGLHLDVSRNFYSLSFLKRYIDLMALYKFNRFHWHLTDGAGWRLQIHRYPELTEKAAWRTHGAWKDWSQNGKRYLEAGHPNASGGYYTQDEARELVDYAARKGITIIPEIEMPGHSDAVTTIFPELSCTGEPYKHAELCIGNEETLTFLTNVLQEVMDIFPSEYIHIGGDEADTTAWMKCAKCRALMEKEGLQDAKALQHHAMSRIVSFLQSKGRKPMGWDELAVGGLPSGTTVMSWRGDSVGVQAANDGHDVIMTPNTHLYFDHYQAEPRIEPEAIGGYIPLRKVYAYEPVSEAIAADKQKHVLGAQGNVWTEYMPTTEQVEYMVFPRALALAEVVWTEAELRDWDDFYERLQQHYRLLQRWQVNYRRPAYTVDIAVDFNADSQINTVAMSTEQLTPGIRYTTDGEEPHGRSPLYTKPIELAVPATVKAAYFVDSGRVGPVEVTKADIHKAIDKTVVYQTPWDTYAAAEAQTLVNGKKGSKHIDDGQWQSFKNNLDVTIDFERREALHEVAINFLHDPKATVHLPDEITVLVSDNGKNFRELDVRKGRSSNEGKYRSIKTFAFQFDEPKTARYLRIVATNQEGKLLATDEVVVY